MEGHLGMGAEKVVSPPLRDDEFREIQRLLKVLCGIKLEDSQRIMVQSRVGARLFELGFQGWRELIQGVKNNPGSELSQRFINLLTTNKTHFFREIKHFHFLKTALLPELLSSGGGEFLVWSAATSRGHEAYSLLMTIQDFLDQNNFNLNYKVLGTDIDSDCLKSAISGVYGKDELKEALPSETLTKYWNKGVGYNAGYVRFKEAYRANLKFRRFNLSEKEWKLPVQFDLIFMRNVLYYLESELVDKILKNTKEVIKPGGVLVLGYSEGVPSQLDGFEYLGGSIYRRHLNETQAVSQKTTASSARKKVVIIEDSNTIQKLLKRIFEEDSRFEVEGIYSNPKDALTFLASNKPDLITLDIDMPKMDGLEFLRGEWRQLKIPTVMVTSHSVEEGGKAIEALEYGAFDCIKKPSFEDLSTVKDEIVEVSWAAGESQVILSEPDENVVSPPELRLEECKDAVIAIGASTGGTTALKRILESFKKPFPPVVVVQHIPSVFSKAFADHLNLQFDFNVRQAEGGEALEMNTVYIAPGGRQMRVVKGKKLEVVDGGAVSGHAPSVDVLFRSLAEGGRPTKVVGVLLTGMGRDGADGLSKLKELGAITIAQDKATSVVFGMPRVAIELGAAETVAPLQEVAKKIFGAVKRIYQN